MLGEQVARQAGEALVADVCARAKHNGCNIMDQPTDKLVGYVKVCVEHKLRCLDEYQTGWLIESDKIVCVT
jgi:hypothetical protein